MAEALIPPPPDDLADPVGVVAGRDAVRMLQGLLLECRFMLPPSVLRNRIDRALRLTLVTDDPPTADPDPDVSA